MTVNTSWKAGEKIFSPVDSMSTFDFEAQDPRDNYRLLINAIIPRPIAFVSTISKSGVPNLAPFSFFNGVSSRPPCLMFSVARFPDSSKKDTLKNIEETEEFVVNFSSEWIAAPLVHCASDYPYGISEFEAVGLTQVSSVKVSPPRVKESPIHFECRLHKSLEIGDGGPGGATIVVGEVVMLHVWEKALSEGKIEARTLSPIARLGGISYATLGDDFSIPVPRMRR